MPPYTEQEQVRRRLLLADYERQRRTLRRWGVAIGLIVLILVGAYVRFKGGV